MYSFYQSFVELRRFDDEEGVTSLLNEEDSIEHGIEK